MLQFDSNFWKSFVQTRLAVPMGDQVSLTLFGDNPTHHRLFAEHLTAEYRAQTSGRGRTVDEWKMRPEQSDNHWLEAYSQKPISVNRLSRSASLITSRHTAGKPS